MQELQLPLLNNQTEPVGTAQAGILNNLGVSQPLKLGEEVDNYKTGVSTMMSAIETFVEENTQAVFQVPFGINSFALTQDNRNLIYGTTSGNVAIFSIRKKLIKNDVPLSDKPFFSILLTKDGSHIVAVGESGINVFSFPSLEHVTSLQGHEASVIMVIQTSDGKTMFSCSEDSTVRRWSLTDFTGGEIIMRHNGMCKSLALDPKGRYLFSGGEDQLIRVYDFETQSEIMQLSGHANWVWALAVSEDSKYLASGSSDNTIMLWNMETFEHIRTFYGHTLRLTALQFSPDSKYLVSASSDTTLRIWAIHARNATRVLSGHTNWVKALIISRDQKFIYSASEDRTFRIWGFPSDIVDEELTTHSSAIRGISIGDRGNTLITSGDDCVIKLWDLREDSYIKDIASTESNVRCALLTKDGRYYIIATEQGYLHVFDMQTHTLVNTKQAHNCAIVSMSISSDDTLLMTGGSTDSKVNIFFVNTLGLKCSLRGHSNWIWSNRFTHDNKYAITGSSDCNVKIWDIETRKCLISFTSLEARINYISITKDDKVLATGDNVGKVHIWNFQEKRCETTLNVHDSAITGTYISNDDQYLFTADLNGKLNIFDLKSRQNITSLSFNGLICFTLDPEETYIYYSTNCKAYYVKNPLKVTELSVCGNGVKYEFISYLHKIMVDKRKVEQNLAMDDWIIMPYRINLLHIYAYYGMFDQIKNSIENRFSMLNSISNETPLTIALYRKSYEITEYLLDKLCDAAVNNKYIMSSIEDSLVLLNLFGNSNLNRVYETVLRISDDPSLPRFCKGNYTFPTYCLNDSLNINPDNFIAIEDRSNEGELIIFKESLVKYNFNPGSKWSLEFLTTLIDCPNQEIFRTRFIQSLLIYKWEKLRSYMYLQALVFLIYMLALCTQILTGSTNIFLILGIFIINLLLLVFEVFQMAVSGYRYWLDLWNFLDVIRLTTCMLYYGLVLFDDGNEWDYELLGIVTLTSWLRGIAYFRLFQKTRYMINLLTEVINDMKAFMCLLVYSTLTFTFLFLVIKKEINFPLYLIGIYRLNLGDVADGFENNIIEFILLTVALVINPIVMLNLLISILGDTFDRVQSTMVIADMKELCEMVIELESLLYWRRDDGGLQYLHTCNSRESEELREDQWEGKIRELDNKLVIIVDKVSTIDESNKTIISKLESLQKSIEALAAPKQ